MKHRLKTIGHATLVLFENDVPLIATDPWLIGSAYWRSWWLEKYPTKEEFEQVEIAKHLYYTHSHPDHFHYPTLRKLGKPSTLHPVFPRYELTEFLGGEGFPVKELEPRRWYALGDEVRMASIPVPIDDSILILETPNAYIANRNDSFPRMGLLRFIRRGMFTDDKPVIMLKSYSPASIAVSIYRDGVQTQMKTKQD
jgi:UDP-MurNAc hydroxylase